MQELNILVSINQDFTRQLRALLHSLFINNKDCGIIVHLLHSELTPEDLSVLEKTVSGYGGTFHSYSVDKRLGSSFPATKTFPVEAFYRIFAKDYLPPSVKRVLYLDSDIIVNGSLLELYNTRLKVRNRNGGFTNYLFAAAEDHVETLPKDSRMHVLTKRRVGIPISTKYVNSGVLLINLELMRQAVNSKEILELIPTVADALLYPDQDLINMVFHKYITYLDFKRYNYCPVFQILTEIKYNSPAIIHFTGFKKPWLPEYSMDSEFNIEAKKLYDKYVSM